ncbi:hypothetical protein U14_03254 [Candidatus Moduliflexus flocculans]|uniref:Uncharacterized protein n=1 Tax=Candidatus Moduliflexus flocculans TaxID=1499966 RepID=A0A081BNP2_9BACT|nr:hypothetical protein U14_03254 [Candidatus Moduliflexus flocculans]
MNDLLTLRSRLDANGRKLPSRGGPRPSIALWRTHPLPLPGGELSATLRNVSDLFRQDIIH